jgi:hypothetical protein
MRSTLKYGLILALCSYGCTFSSEQNHEYAPDPGFNLAHSDPAAVELADSVMAALGGRRSWADMRYLTWDYDTLRTISWDKRDGNVRIESFPDSVVYLFNPDTGKGRVSIGGREVTSPNVLREKLREAASLWINDSFWIRIIYQLKGDGITLYYLGEARTDTARYNLLKVSLDPNTNAPVEEFLAYVDLRDNRIRLCTDLRNSGGETIWYGPGYRPQGKLRLPLRAGAAHNIRVHRTLPEKLFHTF